MQVIKKDSLEELPKLLTKKKSSKTGKNNRYNKTWGKLQDKSFSAHLEFLASVKSILRIFNQVRSNWNNSMSEIVRQN